VAAALFFVLIDLHKINPMYQFSLTWYKDLFTQSISEAKESTGAQNDQIT
jgi:dynein heavy chain